MAILSNASSMHTFQASLTRQQWGEAVCLGCVDRQSWTPDQQHHGYVQSWEIRKFLFGTKWWIDSSGVVAQIVPASVCQCPQNERNTSVERVAMSGGKPHAGLWTGTVRKLVSARNSAKKYWWLKSLLCSSKARRYGTRAVQSIKFRSWFWFSFIKCFIEHLDTYLPIIFYLNIIYMNILCIFLRGDFKVLNYKKKIVERKKSEVIYFIMYILLWTELMQSWFL